MNDGDTKEKILDAAEILFAKEGYLATSLRKITGDAGVNLAAVNYHFGSKEGLLEAVLNRRLVPLNRTRIEALNEVLNSAREGGRRPELSEVMRAFIEPTLRFRDAGPGARNTILLVGRSLVESDDTARKKIMLLFTPYIELFIKSIGDSLPELAHEELIWKSHFLFGSVSHTMRLCGLDALPDPLKLSGVEETDKLIDMLVSFVTAGVLAK